MGAPSSHRLFNFSILRRYKWRATDFQDLQDNGLVAMIRGALQGYGNGCVLTGLELVSTTGLNFTVSPGIAIGPTGNLMVLTQATTGAFTSPTGTVGSRNLVVIQPLLSTPASGMITVPTAPLTTGALFVDQYAQIKVLDGAGLNGAPPATGANDVILFGARLAQSASSLAVSGASFTDRDIPGRRNIAASGMAQKKVLSFDERCLVYPSGSNSVGIKPSQTKTSVLYNGSSTASIFPKSSGSYNGDSGDTFINFTTGAYSGSDTTSAAFTPTIPTAGNFIWALIILGSNDTLSVLYGTAGTYAQCRAAMKNQTTAGAGAVPSSTAFKLAFVLLGSSSGSAITELEVYDARCFSSNVVVNTSTRTIKRITVSDSPYAMANSDYALEVDASGGNVIVTLPARAANQGSLYSFDRVDGDDTKTLTLNRAGSDTFEGGATSYVMDVGLQSQDLQAGTTFWKVRG